jgi:integrase
MARAFAISETSLWIAILLGCGLRRAELAALRKEDIQGRQGHWAIVDLVGKGNHIRTVPMPIWVKGAVDRWLAAVPVTTGRVFRAVSRHGTPWGIGISENVVWYVVRNCAQRMELDHLAPHDLRRTCAKLCHVNGGELEQIQFLLGHASVLTTERYLGYKQNLEEPVNDRFGCLLPEGVDSREGLFSVVEIGIGKTYADFSIASCSKPHLLSGILLAPRNYQRQSL